MGGDWRRGLHGTGPALRIVEEAKEQEVVQVPAVERGGERLQDKGRRRDHGGGGGRRPGARRLSAGRYCKHGQATHGLTAPSMGMPTDARSSGRQWALALPPALPPLCACERARPYPQTVWWLLPCCDGCPRTGEQSTNGHQPHGEGRGKSLFSRHTHLNNTTTPG